MSNPIARSWGDLAYFRKICLALIVCFVFANISYVKGEDFNKLSYADRRLQLLSLGYGPVNRSQECNPVRKNVCDKYPEAIDCSGTGLGFCTFQWSRVGSALIVTTTGEEVGSLLVHSEKNIQDTGTTPTFQKEAATWHKVEDGSRIVYGEKGRDPTISLGCNGNAEVEVWIEDKENYFRSKKSNKVMVTALHSIEEHEIKLDRYRSGRNAIVFSVDAKSLIWTALLMDRGFAFYSAPESTRIPGDTASSLVRGFIPACFNPRTQRNTEKSKPISFDEQKRQSSSTLPSIVASAVMKIHQECKKSEVSDGFLVIKDVNGDGISDYIVNTDKIRCGNGSAGFCGSGGCEFKVYASSPKGHVLVFDDNLHKADFAYRDGRAIMVVAQHGMYCGKTGAEVCRRSAAWQGNAFVFEGARPQNVLNVNSNQGSRSSQASSTGWCDGTFLRRSCMNESNEVSCSFPKERGEKLEFMGWTQENEILYYEVYRMGRYKAADIKIDGNCKLRRWK